MAGKKGSKTGNGREMRGQPLSVRLKAKSIADTSTDCILWTGTKNNKGYGRLTYQSKQFSAHRIAYELEHGPIEDGLFVLHSCDNPLCVNPNHLSLGTQLENMRQASDRGRCKPPKIHGESHHHTKLSVNDVLKIRQDNRTLSKIAADYCMSVSGIWSIKARKSWGHI